MDEDNKNLGLQKKGKGIAIIIYIIVFLIGGVLGYCVSNMLINDDKSSGTEEKKKDDKKEEDKKEDNQNVEITNNSNLDFNFDEMKTSLYSAIQNDGLKANKLSCTLLQAPEGELPNTKSNRTVVSEGTIDTIINKLKTAKSLEKNITSSWIGECYPKSVAYIISADAEVETDEFQNNKVFTLYYADSEDILLVGYKGIGYAFYFNSGEVNNFIESLK